MNISANTLFHLTPKIDFLLNILKNGFYPRYCIEEIGAYSAYRNVNDMSAHPMVCFCDITLKSIQEHVVKYGYYGIGMCKEWGLKNAITPVLYSHQYSPTAQVMKSMSTKAYDLCPEEIGYLLLAYTENLKIYFKSLSGFMYKDGKFGDQEFYFYNEREWRYSPIWDIVKNIGRIKNLESNLEKNEFDNLEIRERNNKLMELHFPLKFSLSDIRYLFVKDDEDFNVLIDFIINQNSDNYTPIEKNMLISKIHVLNRLFQDI